MIRKRRSGQYRLYSRKRDPLPRGGEMWARSRRTRPPSVMSVPCTTSSTRRMRGRSMARARKGDSGRASAGRRWVRRVQETSNAMDLPRGIFTQSPRGVAQGLKRAATRSRRTKGRTEFQSAMSMLNSSTAAAEGCRVPIGCDSRRPNASFARPSDVQPTALADAVRERGYMGVFGDWMAAAVRSRLGAASQHKE